MKILAIDSSTNVGSVALVTEEGVIGESLLNLPQTHSQRLMPQMVDLLEQTGCSPEDIDGIGVAIGPGSFTGVRIGVSTAKTMAQSLEIPIIGISTLLTMAYNLRYTPAYLCPMIKANRERVFTGLYYGQEDIVMKSQETLIDIDDLLGELESINEDIYFIGEIVNEYRGKILSRIKRARIVEGSFAIPKASSIGEIALNKLSKGIQDDLFSLSPNYLKKSQAEIQWDKNYN